MFTPILGEMIQIWRAYFSDIQDDGGNKTGGFAWFIPKVWLIQIHDGVFAGTLRQFSLANLLSIDVVNVTVSSVSTSRRLARQGFTIGFMGRRVIFQEISNRTHWTDPLTWVSNSSSNFLRGPLVRSHSICDGIYPLVYQKINYPCRYLYHTMGWYGVGSKYTVYAPLMNYRTIQVTPRIGTSRDIFFEWRSELGTLKVVEYTISSSFQKGPDRTLGGSSQLVSG